MFGDSIPMRRFMELEDLVLQLRDTRHIEVAPPLAIEHNWGIGVSLSVLPHEHLFAVITSLIQTSGRYPGRLYRYDAGLLGTNRWINAETDVWVETPNGESLTKLIRYPVREVGFDLTRRVMMTDYICCDDFTSTYYGYGDGEDHDDHDVDCCPDPVPDRLCIVFNGSGVPDWVRGVQIELGYNSAAGNCWQGTSNVSGADGSGNTVYFGVLICCDPETDNWLMTLCGVLTNTGPGQYWDAGGCFGWWGQVIGTTNDIIVPIDCGPPFAASGAENLPSGPLTGAQFTYELTGEACGSACRVVCGDCDMPADVGVTVSGLTNDACTNCVAVNGQYTLAHTGNHGVASPCRWEVTMPDSGCGTSTFKMYLIYDGEEARWRFFMGVGANGNIEGTLQGTWSCRGNNTFIIADALLGNYCTGPVTIVVNVPECGDPPDDDTGCPIVVTGLGNAQGKVLDALSVTPAAQPAGTVLIVSIVTLEAVNVQSVAYNGEAFTQRASVTNGLMITRIYTLKTTLLGAGAVTWLHAGGNVAAATMAVTAVVGLGSDSPVNFNTFSGIASADPGCLLSVPVAACRYIYAAVGSNGPDADTDGTWQNGMADGGQDKGTTGGVATSNVKVCEGDLVTTDVYSDNISKTGATARNWSVAYVELA